MKPFHMACQSIIPVKWKLYEVVSPRIIGSSLPGNSPRPLWWMWGGATKIIRPCHLVTVNAANARIYPGRVLEVLERRREPPAR